MLMVSTGTTFGLKMRKCEVANSKRISITTYSFARSSSLFAVASSNFRIQTYSLYRRKCKGGNAPIGASSLAKGFHIYAEQSGPKTPGQRRCNLSEEHHTDGAAICVQNVYLSRAFKNLIAVASTQYTCICRPNLKQRWIHGLFVDYCMNGQSINSMVRIHFKL